MKAEGDRVTYQWQRSKDEGKTWTDISGETSETLNVTIQSSDFGSQYRCIAKDFMGHVATSQAGKLASSIAGQSAWDPEYTIINEPDDYYGRPGDIATFIVEAEGENLSYQWLYQAPGTDELVYCTSSDATTNTIRVEMTAESDGAQYCCFITDANGDMGSTRTATVRLDVRDWTMEYEAGGLRTKRSSAEKTYNYTYNGNQLVRITVGDDILDFTYDANGAPLTLIHNGTVYYYITNLQGDVISLETMDGMQGAHYYYDAWGKILASTGELAELNPLRYRGYVYDQETGFYYVSSRYYDPEIGRWINADNQLSTGSDLTGLNLFAYCGNNPVNRIDPTGEAWWHWALGAAVVAVAAVATVVTCGGFAAAATAVCSMVGSGVAAATTASTVAAGAFIGSATVYGMAVLSAASTSNSVQEFNDQGNWGTVAATAFGGLTGGYDGYTMSKAQTPTSTPTGRGTQNPKVKAVVQKGQAMHKQMDYGPGVLRGQTIAPGCRVDGIDFNNRIIYELKPNNPQAIARGMNQLNRYTSAASQQFGGIWTGVLKLYD